MTQKNCENLFTPEKLRQLFPESVADKFFEALFGDVSEGAYDIGLSFAGEQNGRLLFEFHLKSRPGKCLRCNLTYGLPEVFSRHPMINVKGLVKEIQGILDGCCKIGRWELGKTLEVTPDFHVIPLNLYINGEDVVEN
jgi:hypothetical protein